MTSWRLYAIFGMFIVAGAAITARLFLLQVVEADFYSALSQGQHVPLSQEVRRGDIILRDHGSGAQFNAAVVEERHTVFVDPSALEADDAYTIATAIAPLLERDPSVVEAAITAGTGSYLALANNLSRKDVEQIERANIPNVHVRPHDARAYPGGTLAAHTLGFLGFRGEERAGQYGVEEYYDKELRAGDLALTLDYTLQFMVEKKLGEVFARLRAEGGSAVFMEPKTGAILALANVPAFDPNIYGEEEDLSIFANTVVQKVFEPGSVFKPLVMASGINEGVISPQTTYVDTGERVISGHTIRNSDLKSYGTQTMTQVLEKSLNTGVVFAQEQLGKKKFREYLESFRIGRESGVDIAGEVRGDITNILETNRDINFATASFGQGIAVTPMGLLAAFSALANGGVMMEPHINAALPPRELGRPIREDTARLVTDMLVSVVENGFGKKAAVPGYRVAGKTGTAQVPDRDGKGYAEDESIHSFVGYAPADDPAFIGIISLKNPKDINFSADSVAPVFGEIASFILQYYQIPPPN